MQIKYFYYYEDTHVVTEDCPLFIQRFSERALLDFLYNAEKWDDRLLMHAYSYKELRFQLYSLNRYYQLSRSIVIATWPLVHDLYHIAHIRFARIEKYRRLRALQRLRNKFFSREIEMETGLNKMGR